MRTPLTPATADPLAGAIDRSHNDRIDEPPGAAPWSGVLSPTAPDDIAIGSVCAMLGAARLVDLSAHRLGLADDPRAVAGRLVFIQAIAEGSVDLACAKASHTALQSGHVVIRTASADAVMSARSPARILTLALPRHLLIPRFVSANAIPATGAIFHASLAARLMYELLVGLPAGAENEPGRIAPILDAAAALIGLCLAERPPAPVSLSALAAARADEIIRYLERNYANAALSPASMAEDLGISVRYSHKLLEQTGRSFRQELVALRLQAARRAFAASDRPRQTIAGIAISVGFNDLSQFNRHFRKAYGVTPRAARLADEQSSPGTQPPDRPPRGPRHERQAAATAPSRRASPL